MATDNRDRFDADGFPDPGFLEYEAKRFYYLLEHWPGSTIGYAKRSFRRTLMAYLEWVSNNGEEIRFFHPHCGDVQLSIDDDNILRARMFYCLCNGEPDSEVVAVGALNIVSELSSENF